MKMSSKESTTTNSSDGAGTHHSRESVSRSAQHIYANLEPHPRLMSQNYARKTSIRSGKSSGDGSSLGSSKSQKPMTVTYKSVTTSGKLFSKKTTSVDCGVFVKDAGYVKSKKVEKLRFLSASITLLAF